MTLVTKNGALIVKDGVLAEDCKCCGDWWCYDARGCCVVGCFTSQACEQDCIALGGQWFPPGTPCNFGSSAPPQVLTATLAGILPAINICSPDIVWSAPSGSLTSNIDALFGAKWAGTYQLVPAINDNNGAGGLWLYTDARGVINTGDAVVDVSLQCEFVESRFQFRCINLSAGVISPSSVRRSASGSSPNGRYHVMATASVTGNSIDGFSVNGTSAAPTFIGTGGFTPTLCEALPSFDLTITSLTVG